MANQDLMFQASAAITMKAQLLTRSYSGTRSAPTLLFALGDDVLLVAPVVGAGQPPRRGEVDTGGDVDDVADLVEQRLLAAGLGDLLAEGDDPVGRLHLPGR